MRNTAATVDQIVAVNGESVAGCDHSEVGRMVQRSPPITQITVVHHHDGNDDLMLHHIILYINQQVMKNIY